MKMDELREVAARAEAPKSGNGLAIGIAVTVVAVVAGGSAPFLLGTGASARTAASATAGAQGRTVAAAAPAAPRSRPAPLSFDETLVACKAQIIRDETETFRHYLGDRSRERAEQRMALNGLSTSAAAECIAQYHPRSLCDDTFRERFNTQILNIYTGSYAHGYRITTKDGVDRSRGLAGHLGGIAKGIEARTEGWISFRKKVTLADRLRKLAAQGLFRREELKTLGYFEAQWVTDLFGEDGIEVKRPACR